MTPGLAILAAECERLGFPGEFEFLFAKPRRWRFDWACPELMVAFEREGATWQGGRHTSGVGYRNDLRKYNQAAIRGWGVVRATVDMMASGEALTDLLAALRGRAKGPKDPRPLGSGHRREVGTRALRSPPPRP